LRPVVNPAPRLLFVRLLGLLYPLGLFRLGAYLPSRPSVPRRPRKGMLPEPPRCPLHGPYAAASRTPLPPVPSTFGAIDSSLVFPSLENGRCWRPATRTTHARRSATPYSPSKTPQPAESAPNVAAATCAQPLSRALLPRVGRFPNPRRRLQAPRRQLQAPRRQLQAPRRRLQAPRRRLQAPRRRLQAPRRRLQAPRRRLQAPRRALPDARRAVGRPRRRLREAPPAFFDRHPPVRQPTSATGRPTSAGLPTHVGNWSTHVGRSTDPRRQVYRPTSATGRPASGDPTAQLRAQADRPAPAAPANAPAGPHLSRSKGRRWRGRSVPASLRTGLRRLFQRLASPNQ
jgi:hypothetical protein